MKLMHPDRQNNKMQDLNLAIIKTDKALTFPDYKILILVLNSIRFTKVIK